MTKFKKAISMLLMVAMLPTSFGMNGFSTSGRSFASTVDPSTKQKDYESHWAASAIKVAIKNAMTNGYPDGSFKPDNEITRAEFFALINNAFGFTKTSNMTYSDVDKNEWYARCISNAKAAGYITGYPDGTIKPNESITRQEVAAIISHLKLLKATGKTSACLDFNKTENWSKESILSVIEAKIMNGYPDGNFKPMAFISRAEAVIAVKNCIDYNPITELVYSQAGTYGDLVDVRTLKNNVTVKADGTTLQNLMIAGNLTIDQSVANGEVYLKNVSVKGKVLVNGGGVNSIHFSNSDAGEVFVQRDDGPVRIVIQGDTKIAKMNVYSTMMLEELGMTGTGVEGLVIDKKNQDKIVVSLKNTIMNHIDIKSNDVTLNADRKTAIKEIQSTATGTQINTEVGTRIAILTADKNLEVIGGGLVEKVQASKDAVVKMASYPTSGVNGGGTVVVPVVSVASTAPSMPSSGGYVSTPSGGSSSPSVPSNPVVVPSNPVVVPSNPVVVPSNPVATAPGSIQWIFPKHGVVDTPSEIEINYYAGEQYTNGSVVFTLPDAITANGEDRVSMSSTSWNWQLKDLDANVVISEQGHKVSISNIVFDEFKILVLELYDKIFPSVGDYLFSAVGDKDGSGSAYSATAGTGVESKTINAEIGKNIQGVMSLPSGILAPEGGIEVYFIARSKNYENYYRSRYLIPAGQNGIKYSEKVIPDAYQISYETTNDDYVRKCYYSDHDNPFNKEGAPYIDMKNSDLNNININIVKGVTISGTISLPNAIISNSICFNVIVGKDNENYSTFISIPEGEESVNYSIRVPVGVYYVWYEIYQKNYDNKRYFGEHGMVAYPDKPTALNVTSDLNNINMTLAYKNTISGTVSLPSGTIASGSAITLSVSAVGKTQGSDKIYHQTITIPVGKSSSDYKLELPADSYVLYMNGMSPATERKYYTAKGMVTELNQATLLQVDDNNLEKINMTFVPLPL